MFLDRLEGYVTKKGDKNFIKELFGGCFRNELICKTCPHYYEREEPFLGVNLIVKNMRDVDQSLKSLIEPHILSGENAYDCEKCNKKVRAEKRVSFKKLPEYLMVVLNRFDFNFKRNVRVKINDYYQFPHELDMQPYTQQHMHANGKSASQESQRHQKLNYSQDSGQDIGGFKYTLKGAVIHAGVADSGHYYSLIRGYDTEGTERQHSKWYEFNDRFVSEFDVKKLADVAFGDNSGYVESTIYR